jgi:hypothetical protein
MLSGSERSPIDRLDVDLGAIEDRKAALAALKRQEKVGAAEQNHLRTLLPAERLTGADEYPSLRIRDAANARHLGIVFMHLL